MNYAAIRKTMFFKQMPHYDIVTVSIHAHVAGKLAAELQHCPEQAVRIRAAGQTMDDMVRRTVVKPSALVNFVVCGIRSRFENKRTHRLRTVQDDVAGPFLYVIGNDGLVRVGLGPLRPIAARPHLAHGRRHQSHDVLQIAGNGFPYMKFHNKKTGCYTGLI